MRICVDIQPAVSQRAGIGRYTRLLVEHLAPLVHGEDSLRLFYFDFQRHGDPPCATAASLLHPCRWCPGRLAQKLWQTLDWPPYSFFAGAADLYHFTNFVLPPLRGGRAVVSIHDVSFLRHPDTTEPRNLAYLAGRIRDTVRRADAILTISEFSRREIIELLGAEPGRVFTTYCGVDPARFAPGAGERVAHMRAALALDRPYLLTVGTVEPRKNLPHLVDVFDRLDSFDGDLVIAGGLGWKYEPILARIAASPKAARIRLLHHVPDDLLPPLYAGAEAFVLASLYEGFGLPPLEAMACGTPVLSSAGGSLPEVLGDAACIVPGFDSDAWRKALAGLLGDTALRARLRQAGPARAARYRWEDTARQTLAVYRQVAAQARRPGA